MGKLFQKVKKRIERMVLMMAMLFACRIVDGRTEGFQAVPPKLRAAVAEILISDFGLSELVPAEFGGTAEESL